MGSFMIMYSISPGEVFLAVSDVVKGKLRELSTISSCNTRSCISSGVKHLDRCSAKYTYN
jgi:hypothetical protein